MLSSPVFCTSGGGSMSVQVLLTSCWLVAQGKLGTSTDEGSMSVQVLLTSCWLVTQGKHSTSSVPTSLPDPYTSMGAWNLVHVWGEGGCGGV